MNKYFAHRHCAKDSRGLTFIETILGVALFAMMAAFLGSTYQKAIVEIRIAQDKIAAGALARELLELDRNLSYARVGTVNGIPSGLISPVQTIVRQGRTFIATTTIRNIDLAFDGTASGTPDDLSPADNKLVQIDIDCVSCSHFIPLSFSTNVAPKSLEGASTNGSLFVRVMNASGNPVSGANVHIVNRMVSPNVDINDVTATSGMLQVIDAPPGVESYEVTVGKSGYSTEQTRGAPTTTNPVIPHATVAVQVVTQLTMAIDLTSTLKFSSVSPSCAAIPNVGVEAEGAKLIGTTPDIKKYNKWFSTGASGSRTLNDIEWDQYTITASSSSYDLAGVVPLSPVSISPGSVQNIQLIMLPKDDPAVLVTVKDAITGLPISGASVTIDPTGASTTLITGRGFLKQTDWSGGFGQSDVGDITKYFAKDASVDVVGYPGEARLNEFLGVYELNGTVESSAFDTGSPSNFYQFTFLPGAQPPETGGDSVRFQLATGNSTSSWAYYGPDGTAGTYYTATATDINAIHNGDRYVRYKMYLSTASTSYTPSVTDAMFTFTSSCTPPGQVLFQGIANGTYDITVSKSGYTPYTTSVTVNGATPWQEILVSLAP